MVERKRGAWLGMRWCEQAGIDLEGERETAAEVEEADEYGMEE